MKTAINDQAISKYKRYHEIVIKKKEYKGNAFE